MIFLGVGMRTRLGGGVLLAEVVSKTFFIDLSAYPRWLVVLVGTLAAALVIWILMKLLKWTLWLLFFAVLIGGLVWAGWLLFEVLFR
jgi:hypothetical protein